MTGYELIRETEWTRVYRSGPNELRYESKFLTQDLKVSAASLRRRWQQMPDQERLEFVRAFASKPAWSAEDSEIVDFLMEVGSPEVRSGVALLLLKERDKTKALRSLLRCVALERGYKANYYQAIAYLQDRTALPPLVEAYRSYREQFKGIDAALTADKESLIDYLCCARAVLSLGGPPECKSSIEELQSHPSPEIREFAARILQRPGDAWPW